MTRSAAWLLSIACAACSAGVADSADGGSAPSFDRVWNEVLDAKGCANPFCHGLAVQGGLSMADRDTAYANLVGVVAAGPECGTSGRLRVAPGDPDLSLIVDKLSHSTPACGSMMPPGAQLAPDCDTPGDPTLCNTAPEARLVIDWIAAGANDD
jgi:hypothetical protein